LSTTAIYLIRRAIVFPVQTKTGKFVRNISVIIIIVAVAVIVKQSRRSECPRITATPTTILITISDNDSLSLSLSAAAAATAVAECQPKGGDALWMGSKGRYGSCVDGIMAGKTVIPWLTRTISERFR